MLVRSIKHLVDGEPGRQCVHCHGFVWRQQPKRLHVKDDACDVWDGGGAPREEVGNGAAMSVAPWLIRAGVDAAGEPAWRQRGQCKEPPPPPPSPTLCSIVTNAIVFAALPNRFSIFSRNGCSDFGLFGAAGIAAELLGIEQHLWYGGSSCSRSAPCDGIVLLLE